MAENRQILTGFGQIGAIVGASFTGFAHRFTMSMHLSPIIPAPPHDTSALSAQNDQQAILIWLDARATRSIHTQVSYRKEAVRFVLFITQELGLAGLAQVKVEHIQQYLQHLAQPPAHWLIDTTIPAQQRPATQRLKKPLSASSIAYARLVINSLYRYLQDAGHLKHNPVSLSSQPINNVTDMAEKALEPAAWLFLWQWLIDQEQQARTISQYRLAVRNRWLCTLLYHTGLRRSSIAAGRMSGLARREGKWSLYVPIKGGRQHMVVMHPHLLEELKRYRLAFGLSALPAPNEDQPLISNIRQLGQPVLARNIGADFEKFTQAAAATCDDPYLAEQIRHLTAHGLRHTHATHSLMAGARLEAVQNSLAHRSIATTSIYARASLAMREQHADQLAQFWQQLQP